MKNKTAAKQVGKDFCGVCQLWQLPIDTYFRIIYSNGKVGKETYTKGPYCRSEKKYDCAKHSDIWGSGRLLKGYQLVTTDFIY